MASRVGSSSAAVVGRAKSCTACRQVKLRCDARDTFPAPCSRCVARKYSCRMDSTFKRTPAKRQLEQVTSELNKYQELLAQQPLGAVPVASTTPSLGQDSSPQVYPPTSTGSHVGDSPASTLEVFTLGICFAPDETDYTAPPYALGDQSVSRLAVAQLFSDFHKYFYSHFVILDTRQTRNEILLDCPILFWTIVIIASRHSSHAELYDTLRPAYEQLLASNIIKVIRSVSALHALLMIIMWPLPYPGPTHDPSWGYCGLAVNAALQMGMHRPGFHREYGFPDLTPEQSALRTVTWMVCFQTSVCLSTFLGLPPFVDSTAHIDAILTTKSRGLPRVLIAQTEMQLYVARFTQALDGSTDPTARLAYINMFDRDLERIPGTFQDVWNEETELNLLSAKLYLYSHSFVAGKPSIFSGVSGSHLESSSRIILVSGLSTAVRYVHSFSKLDPSILSPLSTTASQSTPGQVNRQIYVPHHYLRTLSFSAFFLLKFLAIAPDATESDRTLARNHLTTIHTIFMEYPGDFVEPKAVAMTIETLGKANVASDAKVQTRLGASIIYDALLTYGQLEKAKAAAAKDIETVSETVDLGISEEDQAVRDNYLLTEFLNSNWESLWDTNFFDWGG